MNNLMNFQFLIFNFVYWVVLISLSEGTMHRNSEEHGAC